MVLLEEICKQVQTVAEGHSVLTKKLESHDEKLNEISAVVRKIDTHYHCCPNCGSTAAIVFARSAEETTLSDEAISFLRSLRHFAPREDGLREIESQNTFFDDRRALSWTRVTHYFKLQMDTESIKSQTGTIDIKTDRIERELGTVKNAVMDMSKTTKDHEKRIEKLEEKVHA